MGNKSYTPLEVRAVTGRTQLSPPKSLKRLPLRTKAARVGGSGQAEAVWKIFLNCIILPCDLATYAFPHNLPLQQGYSHDHISLKFSDRPQDLRRFC